MCYVYALAKKKDDVMPTPVLLNEPVNRHTAPVIFDESNSKAMNYLGRTADCLNHLIEAVRIVAVRVYHTAMAASLYVLAAVSKNEGYNQSRGQHWMLARQDGHSVKKHVVSVFYTDDKANLNQILRPVTEPIPMPVEERPNTPPVVDPLVNVPAELPVAADVVVQPNLGVIPSRDVAPKTSSGVMTKIWNIGGRLFGAHSKILKQLETDAVAKKQALLKRIEQIMPVGLGFPLLPAAALNQLKAKAEGLHKDLLVETRATLQASLNSATPLSPEAIKTRYNASVNQYTHKLECELAGSVEQYLSECRNVTFLHFFDATIGPDFAKGLNEYHRENPKLPQLTAQEANAYYGVLKDTWMAKTRHLIPDTDDGTVEGHRVAFIRLYDQVHANRMARLRGEGLSDDLKGICEGFDAWLNVLSPTNLKKHTADLMLGGKPWIEVYRQLQAQASFKLLELPKQKKSTFFQDLSQKQDQFISDLMSLVLQHIVDKSNGVGQKAIFQEQMRVRCNAFSTWVSTWGINNSLARKWVQWTGCHDVVSGKNQMADLYGRIMHAVPPMITLGYAGYKTYQAVQSGDLASALPGLGVTAAALGVYTFTHKSNYSPVCTTAAIAGSMYACTQMAVPVPLSTAVILPAAQVALKIGQGVINRFTSGGTVLALPGWFALAVTGYSLYTAPSLPALVKLAVPVVYLSSNKGMRIGLLATVSAYALYLMGAGGQGSRAPGL